MEKLKNNNNLSIKKPVAESGRFFVFSYSLES
jgi:hypothetical protein